jgi:aminomethyltransferase
MGQRTPLYQQHQLANARMVDFAGWDMPINYGSQIDEHHLVRREAGVFDVSHMTVLQITGNDRDQFLDLVLANDIRRIKEDGKAIYSAMLNDEGHVLDDLIVYRNEDHYLMIVNCGTREKDIAWLNAHTSGLQCVISERPDLAILAVQGPRAIEVVSTVLGSIVGDLISKLKVFQGAWQDGWFIAKTGYTGERGVEIVLPGDQASEFWGRLIAAGVSPIGLGARDTLRLEAGMNLYGNDMDESASPYESNMGNTVVLGDRSFVGAQALRRQLDEGVNRQLIGLVLKARGVLRAHHPVLANGETVGEITSGAFSPTLGHSIGLARVGDATGELTVDIRGKQLAVSAVQPPFVRNGKQVYKPLQTGS